MHDPHGSNMQWLEDLNKILAQTGGASHEITKLLILLSSSLLDGQPLPPYLSPPSNFTLAKFLSEIDPEILSAKHFLGKLSSFVQTCNTLTIFRARLRQFCGCPSCWQTNQ